jgi:hypothetical protein
MQRKKLSVMTVAPLLLAAAGGCDGTAGDLETDVTATTAAIEAENGLSWNGISWNGISWNGISWNGLTWNGLTWNGLTWNGITFNGMTWNGITFNGLADPTVNQLVSYMVECALPADDSVTYRVNGKRYTFEGDMGLAPEWKYGPCDGDCQRWVSACLLARLNKTGEHVQISLRGDHSGLALDPNEARDFPRREAAYYGNLFEDMDHVYACYSPGTPSIPRVCGDSLAGCPMKVVGACDRACDESNPDGTFGDCRPRLPAQRRDRVYDETITVFLRE